MSSLNRSWLLTLPRAGTMRADDLATAFDQIAFEGSSALIALII